MENKCSGGDKLAQRAGRKGICAAKITREHLEPAWVDGQVPQIYLDHSTILARIAARLIMEKMIEEFKKKQ